MYFFLSHNTANFLKFFRVITHHNSSVFLMFSWFILLLSWFADAIIKSICEWITEECNVERNFWLRWYSDFSLISHTGLYKISLKNLDFVQAHFCKILSLIKFYFFFFHFKIQSHFIFLYHHHHHHVVPPARISLTISRHFSLSFIASGRSSGLHPVSSHSCCM